MLVVVPPSTGENQMARKPTELVQFKLRIRENLRRKIEKAAEKKAISANAEAVERLEFTFKQDEQDEEHARWYEEAKDELADQHRQYLEEEARLEAKHKSALRDSDILTTMVGGDENAKLLRLMILGMGNNPDWAATTESRKAFADKVHDFLMSGGVLRK